MSSKILTLIVTLMMLVNGATITNIKADDYEQPEAETVETLDVEENSVEEVIEITEEQSTEEEITVTEEETVVVEEKEEQPKEEEQVVVVEEKEEELSKEEDNSFPVFEAAKTVDGVKVNVSAPEGTFPEGSYLSVEKVSAQVEKEVSEVIDEVRNNESNVVSSYTFDIKVLDKDGNEVQPQGNKVLVTFKLEEANNNNLDTQVYHIDDELTVEELTVVESQGETVVVETEGFSYYTVEFTYNNLQYVLDGDSTIELNTILEAIGLSGKVEAVSVSNDQLFTAVQENGVWYLKSLQAFTSTEWMKVTIDGVEYEIVVTDAIPGTNVESEVNMASEEEVSWDRMTIGTGGVILGPNNGTATIKVKDISDKAKNNRKGGLGDISDGSAFISRGSESLKFDGVIIRSNHTYDLVFNIWANSSITANDTKIEGTNYRKDGVDIPFLMVGGYPNGVKGTLNFTGNSSIERFTNTCIVGGSNNSVINVNSGTLTIKDSSIALKDGVKFVVKNGATLVLDNTVIDVTGASAVSAFVVEDGGTLKLQNGSSITATGNIAFNSNIITSSGTVEITDSYIQGINNTSSSGAIVKMNGGTLDINGNTEISDNKGPNGVVHATDGAVVNINSGSLNNNAATSKGGFMSIYDSTLNIADGVTFEDNTALVEGGAIYMQSTTATIEKAQFTKNGARITREQIEEDADIIQDPSIRTIAGGAIKARGGSLTLNGTEFTENIAWAYMHGTGGAIDVGCGVSENYETILTINGAKFTDNISQFYGGAITVNFGTDAEIKDLNGDPSVFENNIVYHGAEFSGGAICIHGTDAPNDGYLEMKDVAIYDNYADGTGGGIANCAHDGTLALAIAGAAIFDNTVGENTYYKDAIDYPDLYAYANTVNHPENLEIYERMFNGGIHHWAVELLNPVIEFSDQDKEGSALIAKSQPSDTSIDGAKVIFTQNKALGPWTTLAPYYNASGGAISNNGKLVIGHGYEIKVVKAWDDVSNNDGYRPTEKEFLTDLTILDPDGQEVDLSDKKLIITFVKEGEYIIHQIIIDKDHPINDIETVILSNDRWMLIISGLEKKGTYSVSEEDIEKYRILENAEEATDEKLQDTPESDEINNYFSFVNHHDIDKMALNVEKIWDDNNDSANKRPVSIVVRLLADGKEVDKLVLDKSNNWKGTFKDLPVFKDGKDIVYTVKEDPIRDYITKIIGSEEKGYKIVNTVVEKPYIPPKTGVE